MKASRDLKPLFIKPEQIPDGGIVVVMSEAERRDMSATTDEQDFQWIVTFKEGWRLRLNQPNLHRVIELCGDETDHWPGKRIGLVVDEFTGRDGETKRYVKIVPAAGITLKRKSSPPPEEAPEDDEIPFD
jgi:hypothetical protein